MRKLRYMLKASINRLGLDIKRIPKGMGRDAQGDLQDPITAEYLPNLRGAAVFDIPISQMRAFHLLGLPLTTAVHPYVRAFSQAQSQSSDKREILKSVLKDYYNRVQPETALQVLQLSADLAPGFADVPAIGALLPWSEKGVKATINGRRMAMEMAGFQYGRKITVEDGLTTMGPVTLAKLELETDRLDTILKSVMQRGFISDDNKNPLKVVGLRRDGEYRWLIEEGQHRLAMAATQDIRFVPAIVTALVRYEDAAFWPQVVDGLFTTKGGQNLFDRLFKGAAEPLWE